VGFVAAADTVEWLFDMVGASLILADQEYDVVLAAAHDLAALFPVVEAVAKRRLRLHLSIDFILFK